MFSCPDSCTHACAHTHTHKPTSIAAARAGSRYKQHKWSLRAPGHKGPTDQFIYTVPVKSLDTPTHSMFFLYLYYFLHGRIAVKTSKLWNNTWNYVVTKIIVKQIKVQSQKPSSAMMKLALMRTTTGKEDPELPLLWYDETGSHEDHHRKGRPRVCSAASQIAVQINASEFK